MVCRRCNCGILRRSNAIKVYLDGTSLSTTGCVLPSSLSEEMLKSSKFSCSRRNVYEGIGRFDAFMCLSIVLGTVKRTLHTRRGSVAYCKADVFESAQLAVKWRRATSGAMFADLKENQYTKRCIRSYTQAAEKFECVRVRGEWTMAVPS